MLMPRIFSDRLILEASRESSPLDLNMPLILDDMDGFFTGKAGRSRRSSRGIPLALAAPAPGTVPFVIGGWPWPGLESGMLPSCERSEADDVEAADDGAAAGRDLGLSCADMSVSHRRCFSDSKPVFFLR